MPLTKKVAVTLLALVVIAVFAAPLEALRFPPIPELSKFAVHVTCLPENPKDVSTIADIYQLSASEDAYVQIYVYVLKFRKMNVELRSEIAIAALGRAQRAFFKDGEEWKSISLEEHNRIFAEGMRSHMNAEGDFDPKTFPCRPAQGV